MSGLPSFFTPTGDVESAWVQGLLVAIGTLILEDPTTIGAGLLVADGRMAWQTAFFGLWAGIVVGDMLLYGFGRLLGPGVVALGMLRPDRVERARRWFDGNLFLAVAGTRFIPGMRAPVYLAAGVFRAHPLRFLAIAVGATLVWTVALLYITIQIGQEVLPLLGRWRWPLAIVAIGAIVLSQWLYRRRKPPEPGPIGEAPVVSVFEFWPAWFFRIPVALHSLWLGLRYGSPLLAAAANPRVFAGGLVATSKSALLDQASAEGRPWFAPHLAIDIPAEGVDPIAARDAMDAAGIDFPVVVKPDLGFRGAGVRVVRGAEGLAAGLRGYPGGCRVVLQALSPFHREAALLYARHPDAPRGEIVSLAEKIVPSLTGDGRRKIRELLQSDLRACLLFDLYAARFDSRLEDVPARDEVVPLVFSGEHAQGAMVRDARHLITDALRSRFDAIARCLPEFHCGGFDLRYLDDEGLRLGESFQIVSVSGARAAPGHIWDPDTRLADAYRAMFQHTRTRLEIGAAMRSRGHHPPPLREFLQAWWTHHRLSRHLPQSD